jgi:hypothetical protein
MSILAKGFVYINLINLLTKYKIIEKDRIILFDGLISKLVLDFKIFIWKYRI